MSDYLVSIVLRSPSRRGFTLLEILVSMVVLIGIVAIIFGMVQQTSNLWTSTSSKIESFSNARAAFDAMTRTISQATLKTYYDYMDGPIGTGTWVSTESVNGSLGTPPYTYTRRSDLHFICGQASTVLGNTFVNQTSAIETPITHCIFFQSPLGRSTLYPTQQQLLNACGFYVAYGPDPNVPSFLPSMFASRYRYRLMEFVQPSESLSVYTGTGATTTSWFTTPIVTNYDSNSNLVMAENIIALVIWPKLSVGDEAAAAQTGGTTSLTSNYGYDTRATGDGGESYNQLPPVVEVTMVAMDEASALKLGNTTAPPNTTLGLTPSLFTVSSDTPTNQLQADLTQMEAQLTASHINFRVFQTEVAISGAKWTHN